MQFNAMQMYSIVVPIFNDDYLVKDFCDEIKKTFVEYLNKVNIEACVELILIDDGSEKSCNSRLKRIIEPYNFVKLITLSRNFGQHIALSCGYRHASGDYVIMLNADMQDPPSEIPKLLESIEREDVDIVYGLRNNRKDSLINHFTSILFNFALNKLTKSSTPLNVSTLRVMSRRFIDSYNELSEKSRYIPGLESWLGYNSAYVPIEHQVRSKGKSSYNLKRRFFMALNSIMSFSDFPLKIASFSGIIISIVGFLLITFLVISKLFFVDYKPGYTSTVGIIVLIGGIQIFVTGIAGLYIGRILSEVQNRPLYIVKEKLNFDE